MTRIAPRLFDRRSVVAGGMLLPVAAAAARLAPADIALNAAAIHWPVASQREMHGYMAIPARAHGRQPAVIVIGGRDTPDPVARRIARGAAQAGFVACTANVAAIVDDLLLDDMKATALWLANGRFGTGRVGAIGLADGIAAAVTLAGQNLLGATALFGSASAATLPGACLAFTASGSRWHSVKDRDGAVGLDLDWDQAWEQAIAFLRAHLL